MPKMDPNFAAAFNSEYPEAYNEAVRINKLRNVKSDPALAVHVPVIPNLLSRFIAGVTVMLLLIGAFFLIAENTGNDQLSIPSGQKLSESSVVKVSSLKESAESLSAIVDPKSDLSQKITPIGKKSSDFFNR